jgi:hypothetical protein
MRIPIIEAAFPHPWTAAARRVLPSPSPQVTATAMWGPLLGWSVLELLAESIDAENPERMALDLFDRLRLREPFGQAFGALGFEGEEGWRVAARIKVVLLSEAGVGKAEPPAAQEAAEEPTETPAEQPALADAPKGSVTGHDFSRAESAEKSTWASAPAGGSTESAAVSAPEPTPTVGRVALAPDLWLDPDVRWLTGVHEAGDHAYLVRERYEELLWWLLMPRLLRLAGEPSLDRAAIAEMGKIVEDALSTAEGAGYRVDALLEPSAEAVADEAEADPRPVV